MVRLTNMISRVLAVLISFVLLTSMSACAVAVANPARVIALKGPSGIGLAKMIAEPDGQWSFTLAGSPDEIVAAIASGSADIAAAPPNLAATLYSKLNGGVRLLALNTLGMLHILDKDGSINTVADLEGRTITASGQGSMPEYVLNYILEKNGINATVEYKAEHAELATLAAAGMADVVMLPEPFATSLVQQNPEYRYALDVTDLFADAAAKDGSGAVLYMGCIIARTEFVEQHPDVVDAFLKAQEASIQFTKDQPEEAARLTQEAGVMPNAAIVLKALPGTNLTFVAGQTMKESVQPLYQILLDANPASIGGALPGDDFYYGANAGTNDGANDGTGANADTTQ